MSVEWRGEEVMRDITSGLTRGVMSGALLLETNVKQVLSRPGAPTSKTGRRQLRRGLRLIRSLEGKSFREITAIVGRDRRGRLFDRPADRQAFRVARDVQRIGTVDPPGGVPRLRTGTLRRSITHELHDELTARVGPARASAAGKYAAVHEYGGGNNIPARPYLRPTARASEPAIERAISDEVRKAIEKGAQ